MAKFSDSFIQGLLNPSYSQGLFEAAKGVGATPGIMMAEKSRVKSQAEIQKLLQQYANDPAQLTAMSQKYAAGGNKEAAKLFEDAATRATAKEDTNRQRGAQGGLMAITQGAARGVPLADMREGINSVIAQGGTQAQIMEAYEAGASGKQEPVILSAGAALVDPVTREVIAERGYKPETPDNKGIKTVERDDGSVVILDANDGTVISTLDPPGKGAGDQKASADLIGQTAFLIAEVDKLMDPGFFESGLPGQLLSGVGGRDAFDREKELLSIRARLGFDQINEMKRLAAESGASGTGLGQISNIEFMSLQSTVDAIYVGMSADAQNKALNNIKRHLSTVQQLASGVAPLETIEWSRPEYKAVGYHKDPETGMVFYAPNGPNGARYKLVDGKFVKIGA